MKVAYSNELRITLAEAKKVTVETFPELEHDLENIKTKIELENLLSDLGLIVYLDYDNTEEQKEFLANEAQVQAEVDERIEEGCEEELTGQIYTEDDIEGFCDPEEILEIPRIDISEFEKEMEDILRAQDGGLSDGKGLDDLDPASPVGKAIACMKEIEVITGDLAVLSDREKYIKETSINFEELLYNYRTMKEYYQTKLDTLDGLNNSFTILLREQRHIEFIDIPDVDERIDITTENRDTYIQNISPGVNRPTTTETEYNLKLNELAIERQVFVDRFDELVEEIRVNKEGTWSFDMEILQDNVNINTGTGFPNTSPIQPRIDELEAQLGLLSINGVSNFTSNARLTTNTGSVASGFKFSIRHRTKDIANILDGRDLLFAQSNGIVTINTPFTTDPSGTLYDSMYNIWGDIELYFSREERGLTTDGNQMDPTLLNTGAVPINGNYIQFLSKFEDFYINFDTNHRKKTDTVKTNIIEPTLRTTQLGMKDVATREVQLLLSFGKVFEVLPEDTDDDLFGNNEGDGTRLKGLIETIRATSQEYLDKLDACQNTYIFTLAQHSKILQEIQDKQGEYSQVSCVKDNPPPEDPMKQAGGDPLGKITMGKEDPNDPNLTKFCYWQKFAQHATAVGLLPLPGPGGLKYWPIGLIIPTPAMLIKIPLPIIWQPLTVIALPMGIFVMFIGLAGIMPSPFLLYIGATGEKMFIVSLRPTTQFGADASSGTLKLLSQGGIALNTKINNLLAGLPFPGFPSIDIPDFRNLFPDGKSTIISDVKEQILSKINKLKQPDVSKLNDLDPSASIAEKTAAFKDTIDDWLSDLKIPSLKFPKNSKGINPTPGIITEMLDQLKKLTDFDLPDITPSIEMVDIRQKMLDKIGGIKLSDINLSPRLANGISVPPIGDPVKQSEFEADVKDVLGQIANAAIDTITPKSLGILAATLSTPVFLNPYQCRGSGGGIQLPSLGPLIGALATLRAVSGAIVGGLDGTSILSTLLGGTTIRPASISINQLIGLMKQLAIDSIPPLSIPNLSNVSIKDLIMNSVKAMTSLVRPSIPAPGPIQLGLSIPGSLLKNALVPAVSNTVSAALNVAALPPFPIISGADVKAVGISFVEDSFAPVETAMSPILTTIAIAKALSTQDMGFGEMLGLGKVNLDPLKVSLAPEIPLLIALAVLDALPAPPYPAVAAAPTVFKLIHPILSQDDLPPWDRMSLSNPLYIIFLDQFCKQGKKGGGFFENP